MNLKRIMAAVLAAMLIFTMAGCSVLPVEKGYSEGSSAADIDTAQDTETGMIIKEQTPEEARAAYIENYKLRYVFGMLIHLPPIPTNAELERLEAEKRQQTPYTTAEPELVNYCRSQTDMAVKAFLNDYSTDAYSENEANRTLKKIYDGQTGKEINGGSAAVTIGYETGYWRITDCEYYNMAFYTNGKDANSIRVLYLCNLYHYVMETPDNLAASQDNTDLTTKNSKVDEYENAFLMVTLDDVCPKDVSDTLGTSQNILPTVLLFTDYETAIKSIESPNHTFAELYLSDDEKNGSIVNGYIGQPIVAMPELVGKYIDVSRPNNIKELDDLGITNYVVEWKENDGSFVPYSILDCNVAAGTLVNITDTGRESKIVVSVASKAVEPTPQPESAAES